MSHPSSHDPEEASARESIYALLSRAVLQEPTDDLLSVILEKRVLRELAPLGKSEKDVPRPGLEDTIIEFNTLFIVPGTLYVKPFESIYLDTEGATVGQVLGKSTHAVESMYLEAGVALPNNFPEPHDHIGAELGFMELLCRREAAELRNGDDNAASRTREIQRTFLNYHLGKWIAQLCGQIQNSTTNPLYREVAEAMESFILSERDRLEVEVDA